MNLYLLSRGAIKDSRMGCYIAALVCAANTDDARQMHPSGSVPYTKWTQWERKGWVLPEFVIVRRLGEADEGVPAGVLMADSYEDFD